jgi:hypothetical protein
MISDLGDNGVLQMVMDIGPEMTNPFTTDYRTGVNDVW